MAAVFFFSRFLSLSCFEREEKGGGGVQFQSYQAEGFLVKVKEHRFAGRRGRIALPIFQFPRGLRRDLQINVWANENLNQ